MNKQTKNHDGKKEAYFAYAETCDYVVIEKCSGDPLEFHQTIESASQAVKRINARWGEDEVFVQKKEVTK